MSGPLISVEGIDGAGKSTLVQSLDERLEDTVTTSEPSTTWVGKSLRKALRRDYNVHPLTTFFLFMADRKHHIETEVVPEQDEGNTVISDRYIDSTLAYQPVMLDEYIDGSTQTWVEGVMEPWRVWPNLTIYIDIPVDRAMERVDGKESYEKEDTLTDVRERYEQLATRFDDRFVRIDGETSKEAVAFEAEHRIREFMEEW